MSLVEFHMLCIIIIKIMHDCFEIILILMNVLPPAPEATTIISFLYDLLEISISEHECWFSFLFF